MADRIQFENGVMIFAKNFKRSEPDNPETADMVSKTKKVAPVKTKPAEAAIVVTVAPTVPNAPVVENVVVEPIAGVEPAAAPVEPKAAK